MSCINDLRVSAQFINYFIGWYIAFQIEKLSSALNHIFVYHKSGLQWQMPIKEFFFNLATSFSDVLINFNKYFFHYNKNRVLFVQLFLSTFSRFYSPNFNKVLNILKIM